MTPSCAVRTCCRSAPPAVTALSLSVKGTCLRQAPYVEHCRAKDEIGPCTQAKPGAVWRHRAFGQHALSRIVCVLLLPLCGCHGMYVHNADRAGIAGVAKKNIDTVDVASIVKSENENLAKILAEEIKSIDARSKLVATLSTIEFAASDKSAADHYARSLGKLKSAFGTDSVLTLQNASACQIDKQNAEEQLRNLRGMLNALGVDKVPTCDSSVPFVKPTGLSADESAEFDETVARYVQTCKTSVTTCKFAPKETKDLEHATTARDQARAEAMNLKKAFDNAQSEYKLALEANAKGAKAAADAESNIRQKAQNLLDALNKLAKASSKLAHPIKGAALADLLTAAASGKTDSNSDPDLAAAMEIAKSFPALAGSIEKAQAARATVPISHLLIALNDLTIQADRDARIAALDVEEINVLERKLAVRRTQANLWRRYSDQLCNLVLLRAGKAHPGKSCERIEFSNATPGNLTCKIRFGTNPNETPEVVNDCALRRSWRELFDADLRSVEKRALYEAAAAYLQVRLLAYRTTVEEFKRVDIAQRRTVVEREAALSQWKSLVAIPADELNGYYSGGIKPAELADLIVKALGFTAIAVGVAQ